ncbi:isopentenyl transferase family protein [Spiroplasma endosymbiont of Phyllotreta cruciferae]|uniref:isopentenyl transferase family protein n=1 Tax=Spiroplasma endosymbiont of Phyllotreta cruciferae TaxID=2886375 RepID=UPI0020A1C91E|nr:isopentenyl transferase family protein [Spiroplasma endosymbiont of Phyllotreta cruciferae]
MRLGRFNWWKKVILIVGPTASGKTDLSIKVAQQFMGECVNADATQIFNGLNLATNKITPAEQVGNSASFIINNWFKW